MRPTTNAALLSSVALPLLSPAAAAPPPGTNQTDPGTVQWGPCTFNGTTLPIACGAVSVPLDYTAPNAGGERLVLQLLKVPATAGPAKGSILFNFGGPGQPAQESLAWTAETFMNNTGGEYDLVAFDPRGTGTSIPWSCYASPEAARLAEWTNRDIGTNASDVALGTLWAQAKLKSDACQAGPRNATAGLLGTAFTARDFIQVVDALGGDRMLRYYGISYGTTLGATIAAMFPERVERMLLDGVMNVHEYYHGFDLGSVQDVDVLFRAFLDECTAAPAGCALGRNVTADALETSIYSLLDTLKYEPVSTPTALVDYTSVKNGIFNLLYNPYAWSTVLAPALHALLTGNLSNTVLLSSFSADPARSPILPERLAGIQCADKDTPPLTELAAFRPVVDALEATSRLYGEGIATLATRCARYAPRSKERYAGDFAVRTRHPVLLASSSLDPITPLASAYNLSASLEGSVVLEQKSYGHSTLAQDSTCTRNAFREYFQSGKLPEPGKTCEVDDKRLFGSGGSNSGSAAQDISALLVRRLFQ